MNRAADRRKLVSDLLEAVKQCQVRFGGRSELATELDSRVIGICEAIEAVMSHGLKFNRNVLKMTKEMVLKGLPKSIMGTSSSHETVTFWHFIRLYLNKHEYERYMVLKNIHTDIGRGRAWIRSSLNENSLERYMLTVMADELSIRPQFYEDWALIVDQESNSVLPNVARGLSSILFAINIDNSDLNVGAADSAPYSSRRSEPLPVILGTSVSGATESLISKPRKIVSPRIVSLGDDDDASDALSVGSTRSAPATSFSSPDTPRGRGNWYGREISECHSETEINGGPLGPNLLLTPVGDDSTSIGDLALANDEPSPDNHSNYSLKSETASFSHKPFERSESNTSVFSSQPLQEQLQQQKEENESLRAELSASKRKADEKLRKSEMTLSVVSKENEILKVQLKKYISAIQLLKQGDKAAEQQIEDRSVSQEGNYSISSYVYFQEANEYEKKLVQVAEMHGELVEFNDRLHKVILQKEAIIRRLRDELVELRGPFPEGGNSGEDDDISISSDISSVHSLQGAGNRPLINIWIPTAFLAGQQKSSSHHVYQVYVRVKDEEWNVYRRYSQFHGLHKQLKKSTPLISTFDFPPKKTIGNRDARIVQERRKRLEHYLRCVINAVQAEHTVSDKRSLVAALPFLGDRKSQNSRSDSHSRSDSQSRDHGSSVNRQYVGL